MSALKAQVALVIGHSRGFGEAIASELARAVRRWPCTGGTRAAVSNVLTAIPHYGGTAS